MFCTNCGATISDDAIFCPLCGTDLEEVLEILKETPSINGISMAESDLKLSLEGDVEAVFASATDSNEFKIIVHNTSPNSIPGVEVQLYGSPAVEALTHYKNYGVIRSGQKMSTPFIIYPKAPGVFTLTAKLQSGAGHSLTFPIEVRVETAKYTRTPMTTSRPIGGKNQVVAVLVIFALIGLILMIGGIISLIRGGLPFNAGITMIVIGFLLIIIGTKGQCCILPFACACGDGCDCDCDC